MNLRTRHMPGVYTVTDEDTGEVLIFALYGELEFVKLFELSRQDPRTGKNHRNTIFSDYA